MKTLALAVIAGLAASLSACETPTANANVPEGKAVHPGGGAAHFTGADSAEVEALKARIAALENAILLSGTATRLWVNGAETLTLENDGVNPRAGVVRGQMRVEPGFAFPTGTRALEVAGSGGAFFGDSGFYPDALVSSSRMTSLHLVWNRPNPLFGGYTRTVSDVTVGNTDSGGSGYRVLRVPN